MLLLKTKQIKSLKSLNISTVVCLCKCTRRLLQLCPVHLSCAEGEDVLLPRRSLGRENGKERDAGGSCRGAEEGDGSCRLSFSKQQLLVLLLYRALKDKLFIFQSSGANMLHLLALPRAPSTAQTQEHIKSSW